LLESLITSKTRVKLLLKFFLNSNETAYLRSLESEFGESSNAIRVELNRLENAGLLRTNKSGNKKIYQANTKHPLYGDINNILMKYTGLDHIIEKVTKGLGDIKKVYISGDIAKGKNTEIIDLILVGNNIDRNYLLKVIEKTERLIDRKIRFLLFSENEIKKNEKIFISSPSLLIWQK